MLPEQAETENGDHRLMLADLIKLTQRDATSSIPGRLTKKSALFSDSATTDKTD